MAASSNGSVDVSVSTVVHRDYETPLKMLQSLAESVSPELSMRLFVVDNSDVPEGGPLCAERDAFRREAVGLGFVEYVDAGGNLGFGAANNLALMRSNSVYHAFVNPDVVFTDDALSKLASFMDVNPDVGMCVPRVLDVDGALQPVYWQQPSVLDAFNRMFLKGAMKRRSSYYTLADEDYTRPFQVPFAQGSFLFGRTALLKELGGFDEAFFMYLEDADLCRRVNGRSSLVYCPDAAVVHKWERGSHKDARLLGHHLKSYMTFFRKWGLRLA